MRSVNFKAEDGSAILEFIGFGLLLQIPLMMFAGNLVTMQHDQLTAEAITRDLLRSYVLSNRDPVTGVAELASAYRVSPSRIKVSLSCKPSDCDQEKAWVYLRTQIGSLSAAGVIQR